MNRPSVSVIIPMYNVEATIAPTLACIPLQGVGDAEYIFIDDCSTDGTIAAVQAWIDSQASDGPAFKLVKCEKNGGVAAARNTGLDNAQGEYVYFLDADDWLDDNALLRMLTQARETQADIVGIEWNLTFSQNERHMRQAPTAMGQDLFDNLCYGVSRWNLWLFLTRRKLWQGLRFTPGDNMGEDMMAMLIIAKRSAKVVTLHEPLYHYVQTNPNALTRNWTDENRRQVTANLHRAIDAIGLCTQLQCMKLTLKLPLLITADTASYEKWQQWWPEANAYVDRNPRLPLRTRLIQKAAAKRQYWLLKAYYRLIIKFVYGIIFK